MNKRIFKTLAGALALTTTLIFSSCYSVFNGGTGGLIVDAESTSNPKAGIANVDVYAFTDCELRDANFNCWIEGSIFVPANCYYGHTTTNADGSFTISNLVWKATDPDFGKDADYTIIYLLFYHENYGLTKGQTVITSDSTSDTVYAELTSVRKTTALNINIYDISNSALTSENVLVKVSVPQTTDTIKTAAPKVYEQIISGSDTINISYPRWKNAEDKTNNIETKPEVSISYSQSTDSITWKACANANNEAQNYAFLDDNFSIKKTINNSVYSISLYGKSTRLSVPTINGTHGNTASASSDGVIISMKAKDASGNFTIDCGETSTYAQNVGTNGTQIHGSFSGLGSGYTITDTSYTGKYTNIEVQFYAAGNAVGSPRTFRSDTASYNVSL